VIIFFNIILLIVVNQMFDSLFYLLWRDVYVRSIIRNTVCQNTRIIVESLYELEYDKKYISLLSPREYNIDISLIIKNKYQFQQFINSNNREYINSLKLYYCRDEESDIVQFVLQLLPTTIHHIQFSILYKIADKELILPSTLIHFDHFMSIKKLKRLLGGSSNSNSNTCNKVHHCIDYRVPLKDIDDDLKWINEQPGITDIKMPAIDDVRITKGMIPSHIKKLRLPDNYQLVDHDALPKGLEYLSCHRKFVRQFSLTTFPSSLKTLYIDGKFKLEKSLLPPTLSRLEITETDKRPIERGVLPAGLTSLFISNLFHEIEVGVLPSTLKQLEIYRYYKQPLKPYILPDQLTDLTMHRFTEPLLEHMLPSSLTKLYIPFYNHSFANVGPLKLNNLKYLDIYTLEPSLLNIIENVQKIQISFRYYNQDINFQQTGIKDLHLINLSEQFQPLIPTLIPSQVKILKLNGLKFNSINFIPSSCIYLENDIENFDINLLHSTIKYKFKTRDIDYDTEEDQ